MLGVLISQRGAPRPSPLPLHPIAVRNILASWLSVQPDCLAGAQVKDFTNHRERSYFLAKRTEWASSDSDIITLEDVYKIVDTIQGSRPWLIGLPFQVLSKVL